MNPTDAPPRPPATSSKARAAMPAKAPPAKAPPAVPSKSQSARPTERRPDQTPTTTSQKPRRWEFPALLLVAVFVSVVHHIPHLPGPAPQDPLDAYPTLFDRLTGPTDPYPLHVDEHYHFAQMAQVDRTGLVEVPDPYTGDPPQGTLFSVPGMRSERGWDIGILQLSHLTDASVPTLIRFLPAAWSGFLCILVYQTLRPAPGALASAALVAVVPTTVRMLGPGFLVPSAFALPWIVAVVVLALHARGPGRYAGIVVVVTGAFFMHLVMGTLTLAAGIAAALVSGEAVRTRWSLAAATLLPLAWILPANWADVTAAVGGEHGLPFETEIFATMGIALVAAAAVGAATAWMREDTRAHRVFLVLAVATAASMAWSVAADHRNDATYSRLVPTFFVSMAVLGGLGLATGASAVARMTASWGRRAVRPALLFLLTAAALTQPLATHLSTPYYRVFDDVSWQGAADLAEAGVGPGDTYLAHPWRSPVYTALTGATPWTYLTPGSEPVRGEDYARYLQESYPATWYQENEIDAVVGPIAPPGSQETRGLVHIL